MNPLFLHHHDHAVPPDAPGGKIAGSSPFTIAVSGKGGTGKTTFSALLIRELVSLGESPILAVDADPNANLHEALGLVVGETLGCMREDAFNRQIPGGMGRKEYLRYRFQQVLVEAEHLDLVAMGRPEGHGCYCFANDVLRESMLQLGQHYRFLVIDTEAGMEHISRGTIGHPDLLLIVSDPGARGLRTIVRIRSIAAQLGLEDGRIHTVINRFRGDLAPVGIGDRDPLCVIPYDPEIEQADLAGEPVSQIATASPARTAIRDLARKIREMARNEPG
ncbi:ATP-binding protein [Methanoregula formicica]|uniref:CO dehydrogenase maturation factor n=1 Tax=Methanoregula formicica (strain DSM 22288 / NBRC 105244 / SMSP) TaxID=593750 RepID=L0HFR2_METFS|nr:AAA family ATPase [Methanoregula formicica]AGB01924.1 CO dehydrogenase maturation factor [Methanoregula formicica SMSP]